MMSALFVPNLATLAFLAQLQQKVALIRWTNKAVSYMLDFSVFVIFSLSNRLGLGQLRL